jgi:hypothetical protein
MVRLRCTLFAALVGTALLSQDAIAQHGSSSSLIHTVSVTVPSRVKVQVAALSPAASPSIKLASASAATQGLSLSVRGTRAWVLSIGSPRNSSAMRWSLESGSGFSPLTSTDVSVASGGTSEGQMAATVFFRQGIPVSSAPQDGSGSPVVLTISAP